ncbi:hypothetical protein V5799_012587 [Amblyomma americanum]|uniref:Uncharacterized protein n=1 Tax=Amblyomma americanum TaxID=6943 RepID=A0AAQ4EE05_AMBAM
MFPYESGGGSQVSMGFLEAAYDQHQNGAVSNGHHHHHLYHHQTQQHAAASASAPSPQPSSDDALSGGVFVRGDRVQQPAYWRE